MDHDTASRGIKYKDGTNLNYDGKSIHENCNGRIEHPDRSLRANLAAI